MRKLAIPLVVAAILGGTASAQDLVIGQILDNVPCKTDVSQHYSLYVPTYFTPERRWPVIFAFDAGGRGRRAVERYQAAAEKYGYIVAGSNNSKNGPWEISVDAAKAMTTDVEKRFPIDAKRRYTAGMSGGARVAMMLAMSPEIISGSRFGPAIAGVLASSAGFPEPDVDFREEVPFPVFGSAGTDDFNHEEMRQLDQLMKSPHRVEVFVGTHEWLPVELAMDGVEWMEIQAVKRGLRPRDQKLVDGIFARRIARAEAQTGSLNTMRELKSIVVDFQGLEEVSTLSARAMAMERQQDVKDAVQAERRESQREIQITNEVFRLRNAIASGGGFAPLKERVTQLLEESKAEKDSTERRIARRVLAGLSASSRGFENAEFQGLLNQIRPATPPARP